MCFMMKTKQANIFLCLQRVLWTLVNIDECSPRSAGAGCLLAICQAWPYCPDVFTAVLPMAFFGLSVNLVREAGESRLPEAENLVVCLFSMKAKLVCPGQTQFTLWLGSAGSGPQYIVQRPRLTLMEPSVGLSFPMTSVASRVSCLKKSGNGASLAPLRITKGAARAVLGE